MMTLVAVGMLALGTFVGWGWATVYGEERKQRALLDLLNDMHPRDTPVERITIGVDTIKGFAHAHMIPESFDGRA